MSGQEVHQVFTIGGFSKLSRVSVKTLRYYDQVGLLKPARVDRFTNYRYYSVEQLPRLNRILALKDLGFSLEQIARLLDEGLSADQLRGMLRMRQAEIQQTVREEQERLARVEARLNQIEREGIVPKEDVVIKRAEPLHVATVRDIAPSYSQLGSLFGELYGFLAETGAECTGPAMTIYHDTDYRESDVDVEVCAPVDASVSGNDRVSVRDLPGVEQMACLVHTGSYNQGFTEPYGILMNWVEANGYRINGPNREIYLQGGEDPDDESYVTEIQFPVEKA